MSSSTQINKDAAQERQTREHNGSNPDPGPTDDFPTDGKEAQRRREEMQKKEKAEGDRRD